MTNSFTYLHCFSIDFFRFPFEFPFRFYWEYLPSKKELAIPTELSDSFSAEYSAGLRLPFGVDDSGVEERVLWREFPPDVVDGQFDDAEDDYSQPLVISLGNLYL